MQCKYTLSNFEAINCDCTCRYETETVAVFPFSYSLPLVSWCIRRVHPHRTYCHIFRLSMKLRLKLKGRRTRCKAPDVWDELRKIVARRRRSETILRQRPISVWGDIQLYGHIFGDENFQEKHKRARKIAKWVFRCVSAKYNGSCLHLYCGLQAKFLSLSLPPCTF